jgi:hypothetical protein
LRRCCRFGGLVKKRINALTRVMRNGSTIGLYSKKAANRVDASVAHQVSWQIFRSLVFVGVSWGTQASLA